MFEELQARLISELGPDYAREALFWCLTAIVGAQCVKGMIFRVLAASFHALRPQPGEAAREILKQLDGEHIEVSTDGSKILASQCEVNLRGDDLSVFVMGDGLNGELSSRDRRAIKRKHVSIVSAKREKETAERKAKMLKRLRGV